LYIEVVQSMATTMEARANHIMHPANQDIVDRDAVISARLGGTKALRLARLSVVPGIVIAGPSDGPLPIWPHGCLVDSA
jgi:hypothetical protein